MQHHPAVLGVDPAVGSGLGVHFDDIDPLADRMTRRSDLVTASVRKTTRIFVKGPLVHGEITLDNFTKAIPRVSVAAIKIEWHFW